LCTYEGLITHMQFADVGTKIGTFYNGVFYTIDNMQILLHTVNCVHFVSFIMVFFFLSTTTLACLLLIYLAFMHVRKIIFHIM